MSDFSEKKVILDSWVYESMKDSIESMSRELIELKRAREIIDRKDSWIQVQKDVINEQSEILDCLEIWVNGIHGAGTFYELLKDISIHKGLNRDEK